MFLRTSKPSAEKTACIYTCRYGRVICCIGVNPDKRYDVSPQTRAGILRKMLVGIGNADDDDGNGRRDGDGTASTGCDNVQVQGTSGIPRNER